MIVVGLTGGIGAGKSTVSTMLAERGAVIVDADAIVRELQAPGAPLLDVLAARFGSGIIDADGALDRAALAAIVFDDRSALDDLNALVHPAVRAEIAAPRRAPGPTPTTSSCSTSRWSPIRGATTWRRWSSSTRRSRSPSSGSWRSAA